jgi:flagellar hook assembly protein FlgD
LPTKVILLVEPKVFTPEEENASISYTLPFNKAVVRLYVYDKCGRCVRKLINGALSGAHSRDRAEKNGVIWSHLWDGKSDNGEILPIGIYIIYLEAKDQLSETLASKKTTVVIAK